MNIGRFWRHCLRTRLTHITTRSLKLILLGLGVAIYALILALGALRASFISIDTRAHNGEHISHDHHMDTGYLGVVQDDEKEEKLMPVPPPPVVIQASPVQPEEGTLEKISEEQQPVLVPLTPALYQSSQTGDDDIEKINRSPDASPMSPSSFSPNQLDVLGHSVQKHKNERKLDVSSFLLPINPHPFQWIISEPDFCKQANSTSPLLLVIVHNEPSHFQFRQAIRETWASPEQSVYGLDSGIQMKVLFALGWQNDVALMEDIKTESDVFHDIIQEDFIDHYKNLTYKAIMWMRWVSEYCPKAVQIVKIDDDTFINRFGLLKLIRNFYDRGVATKRTITCKVWVGMQVVRDPSSPWYVTKEEYKEDQYLVYCSGAAYMFSTDLAALFCQKSMETKFFWVDDVYATGMLREAASNVTYQDMPEHMYMIFEDKVKAIKDYTDEVLFIHTGSRSDGHYYWWTDFMETLGFLEQPTTTRLRPVPNIVKLDYQ